MPMSKVENGSQCQKHKTKVKDRIPKSKLKAEYQVKNKRSKPNS